MHNKALKENLGDDLSESFIVHLMKEVKEKGAKPVSVCVGVAEM
jgi:hypothetical protein